jgi:hypothetical protein
MGIDFEFNTKKVALMQILFEVHKKSQIVKKYYIIYPPNLNQKVGDYLKYNIMANTHIIKILHGAESLDIPYLIDDYFYEDDYKNFDCSIVLQTMIDGYNYFWNGLYYFDINKMDNLQLLNWNLNGHDVGGMMFYWLNNKTKNIPTAEKIRWTNNNYNQDGIYYIKHLWSCTWNETEIPENLKNNTKLIEFIKTDVRNQNGKFFCEIYDNKFLHYRAGGNWERRDMRLHEYLSHKLKEILIE